MYEVQYGEEHRPRGIYRDPVSQVSQVSQLTTQRRNLRKAKRRLARRAAKVAAWWASMPEPRPHFVTSRALRQHLGAPLSVFGAALRWLGWFRLHRQMGHQRLFIWLPPGSPIQPRPRGGQHLFPCL